MITASIYLGIAVYCEQDTERGIVWPRTIQGGERNQLCRSLEQKGNLLQINQKASTKLPHIEGNQYCRSLEHKGKLLQIDKKATY